MQKVTLIGRVVKDAVLKKGDFTVCNFTFAADDGYGEKKSTLWMRCSLWGARAEKLAEHLTKGKPLYVEGRLTHEEGNPRTWTTDVGENRASFGMVVDTVEFLPAPAKSASDTFADEVGATVSEVDEVPF